MNNPALSLVRRLPNGRLQACDPCRRQKLSCNHGSPCQRCSRKKNPLKCTYGQPYAASDAAVRRARKSTLRSDASPVPSVPVEKPNGPGKHNAAHRPSSLAVAVGYLGSTSFEAVLEETAASLSLLGAAHNSNVAEHENPMPDLLADSPTFIRELCLCVLRELPSPSEGLRLFRTSVPTTNSWQHIAACFFLRGLYATWGDYLTSKRTDVQLEEMARAVCFNTSREVRDDIRDPSRWLKQFTGSNLRWDTLGLLFYYWLPAEDTCLPRSREQMGRCIRICREFVNRPTIWLQYVYSKRAALESMYTGDASTAPGKRLLAAVILGNIADDIH
jgi:hypothetical protein